MMRTFLARLGIPGTILIILGVSLWVEPVTHQIRYGWSTPADIFLLFGGAVLILATLLPRVVCVNLVVFVAAIAVMELIAAIVLTGRPRDRLTDLDPETREPASAGAIQRDTNLGYRLAPDRRTLVQHTSDGKLIYEVTLTTDSMGRRLTPPAAQQYGSGFLVFLGDSFTLGAGVSDDQTFPYFISTLLPQFSVYNYGVGGYGPQNVLALLEERDLRSEIPERYGIAVYTYIDDHVHRAAFTTWSGASRRSPYYVVDKDGGVSRRGNFNTTHPVLYTLYEDIFPRSHLFRLFRVNIPRVGDEEVLLACRLIVAAQQRFREQIKHSDFLVVFYPGRGDRYASDMKKCIRAAGISYLDYSQEPWPAEFHIPYDNHPNALGHLQFAKMIAPHLRTAMEKVAN